MPRGPVVNRRAYRRVKAAGLVRPVGIFASSGATRGLGDISLGGLRVFSDDEHEPGHRFELELLLPRNERVLFVAEVVWVEALPGGSPARYDMGLKYVDVTPGDLQRISSVLAEDGDEA